jgi:hypothetical protein
MKPHQKIKNASLSLHTKLSSCVTLIRSNGGNNVARCFLGYAEHRDKSPFLGLFQNQTGADRPVCSGGDIVYTHNL